MRGRTWTTLGLHPVPLRLYALDLACVAVPLAVTVAVAVEDTAVTVSVAFAITIPLPIASIIRITITPTPTGAGANAESDRTGVRCQAEGTKSVTAWARGDTSGNVYGRTTDAESLTGKVAWGASVTHDDISVAVAFPFAGLAVACLPFPVELFALPVDEHFAFSITSEVAFAITAERGETERLWCAPALVRVEFSTEHADILFILLADFAMLCL